MKKLLCLSLIVMLTLSVLPATISVSANDGSSLVQFFEGSWPDVRVGMKDAAGNVVIEPTFSEIRDFSNGFAIAAIGPQYDLQWGLIDVTGWAVVHFGEMNSQELFSLMTLVNLPAYVTLPTYVESLHWNQVRPLLGSRSYIEIFDIRTGITYTVRSFAHGNHADVETIDAWNTELHLQTFGGFQTWGGRPVWATFNGRTFAAAIHSMQHDVSTIHNNNMNGHVCLHFFGSTNNFTYRDMYSGQIAEAIRFAEFVGTANWLRSLANQSDSGYVHAPYESYVSYEPTPSPRIRINGEFVYVPADDQAPVIIDGRTLVPLRAVMEALGFEVLWVAEKQMIFLDRPGYSISVQPNNDTMVVNLEMITLDVPPQIMNDRTMVPVRAISEATGMRVSWDSENLIVDIESAQPSLIISGGFNPVLVLPDGTEIRPEPPETSLPPTEPSADAAIHSELPRSAITLPNAILTAEEQQLWEVEYMELGGANAFEIEVVRLANEERAQLGIAPLEMHPDLMRIARFKSQSMADLNYMAHHGVYGAPWDLMRAFGFIPGSAAENIARGQRTPEEVILSWMNSPGHRANMLNSAYNVIGVGAYADENGTILWTQMFSSI